MDLERRIDLSPTAEMIAEYVELSIRNRQCREELTSYNNSGKFLCRHPILLTDNLYREMTELLLSHPDEFMKKMSAARLNIARYQSYVNNKDKSDALSQNQASLEKWQNRLDVMTAIFKEHIYERKTAGHA